MKKELSTYDEVLTLLWDALFLLHVSKYVKRYTRLKTKN